MSQDMLYAGQMGSEKKDDFAADVQQVTLIGAVEQILRVVCQFTGLGFSAVARVTDERWVACAVHDQINFGLAVGGELQLSTTLCREVHDGGTTIAIDDAETDSQHCTHPTPKRYNFRSYISTPIHLPDGQFFGTLCAIDPRPMSVKRPEVLSLFSLFADLIGRHLDAQQRAIASEAALLDERETAQLREQFIAVLGHDLRNPLGAVRGAAELLQRMPGAPHKELLEIITRSAVRMSGLIENLMDLARGRLGQGMHLRRKPDAALAATLEHAIDEIRTAWPKRRIDSVLDITCEVDCDSARIAQMLSNLVANAVAHGAASEPIQVSAKSDANTFKMSVSNAGRPIPAEVRERLFEPFVRANAYPGQEGLGLGLYIVREIAVAHGGTIQATSDESATRFTFQMPCSANSAG